jgi:hypothetical protein
VPLFYKYERHPSKKHKSILSLTGKTYQQQIERTDVETIVLYWTTGCKKCIKLLDQFIIASRLLHKNKSLVFASINLSKNEIPPMGKPEEFPKLHLFTTGRPEDVISVKEQYLDSNMMVDFIFHKSKKLFGDEIQVDESVLTHEWMVIPAWRREQTGEDEVLEGEFYNKFYKGGDGESSEDEIEDESLEMEEPVEEDTYIDDRLKDEL